ncbi:MAG: Flp family type IVb pilin [Clostridia bacterium]|nr:Flp family type IVb pilin [Clostridia bacterium]
MLVNYLRNLTRDEEGQAITEYALIIGLIVLVVIIAITALGGKINEIFKALVDQL